MNYKPYLSLVFLLCLGATGTRADTWSLPGTSSYLSDNGRFCFVTVPSGDTLKSAYLPEGLRFEHPDDVEASPDSALGILYELAPDSVYRPLWRQNLVNIIEPVGALVHDEGKWAATFDNWHSKGYGDNVVVIYGADGRLVRALRLKEMFPADKIEGFMHSSSSIWWLCSAEFDDDRGELVIRAISNGEAGWYSDLTVCEDYVRVRLSDGEVMSFASDFDSVLATYPDSCYDRYRCPTFRYYFSRMQHPDSSLVARFESLQLEGNPLDSLRTVYDSCKGFPWETGTALEMLGREVLFASAGLSSGDVVLLVEVGEEYNDYGLRDSLPVIVRLPDSTLMFPLASYDTTFSSAILYGAERVFSVSYGSESFGDEDPWDTWVPFGRLATIYTADSTIERRTNVLVLDITFGSRVFIDLTKE